MGFRKCYKARETGQILAVKPTDPAMCEWCGREILNGLCASWSEEEAQLTAQQAKRQEKLDKFLVKKTAALAA
jgi:hypothetical protein